MSLAYPLCSDFYISSEIEDTRPQSLVFQGRGFGCHFAPWVLQDFLLQEQRASSLQPPEVRELLVMAPICFTGQGTLLQPVAFYRSSEQPVG